MMNEKAASACLLFIIHHSSFIVHRFF